jgi:hypothetical protein
MHSPLPDGGGLFIGERSATDFLLRSMTGAHARDGCLAALGGQVTPTRVLTGHFTFELTFERAGEA